MIQVSFEFPYIIFIINLLLLKKLLNNTLLFLVKGSTNTLILVVNLCDAQRIN